MKEKVALLLEILGLFIALAALAGAGYAAVQSARSNGETDYCYVEVVSHDRLPPAFQLWGHRPWRTDRLIGAYVSLEQTTAAAAAMECRFR